MYFTYLTSTIFFLSCHRDFYIFHLFNLNYILPIMSWGYLYISLIYPQLYSSYRVIGIFIYFLVVSDETLWKMP